MATVASLLREKGCDLWHTTPDQTVFEALRLMAEKNVGALLVLEGRRPVGIFSERDYARKLVLKGKFSQETQVREVMTEKLITVRPDETIEQCMTLMTDRHIRHLPVMDGDELLGIISIGDVVRSVISEQKFTISLLENYITGSS